MTNKVSLIIAGVLVIISGLYVSLGIFVYSGKENDSSGYFYLILTSIIVICGILILRKGIIKKR
ncbi:hypothetical protein ULMS_15720 [Patiriisocius marinistellae]|uniref:Uncharacterized protein n=1 Tax=Patiriisocius marinistellae TaxID=2494560 RepID=A0A5J4FY13_9FLAO|nr:hypothetical protein ULMS_15720 [Patiriisocius marinistellae]